MNIGAEKIIHEMPQGIINWYTFEPNTKALLLYSESNTIFDFLLKKQINTTCVTIDECLQDTFVKKHTATFDYIISISTVEICKNNIELLKIFKKLIKENGKMLLAFNNRLALKNFCGEKDKYTNSVFDGIENYKNISSAIYQKLNGRLYTKSEMLVFLQQSGWLHNNTFSVFPDLQCPQLIYSENYTPEENIANRYFAKYKSPKTVFLKEEFIIDDIIKNGLLHGMANAFLIECCSSPKDFCQVDAVTISMDRGHEDSIATIINKNKTVEKLPLFAEGTNKIKILRENHDYLKNRGLKIIDGATKNDRYVMPYIKAQIATAHLQELLDQDTQKFISEIDLFKAFIEKSSDVIMIDENLGPILENGFPDLVPLNCFYKDGEYIFYDQEFVRKNYPLYVIILRMLHIVYESDPRREEKLSFSFFLKRYKLEKYTKNLYPLMQEFTDKLRHQTELKEYNTKTQANWQDISKNKLRMNYSENEFEKLFYNPFTNLENKKIIIFGAGKFAEKFIAMYKRDYDIDFLVDNNSEKHGQKLGDYQICAPEKLITLEKDKYKVIICIKNYSPILAQLQIMGISDIAVYQFDRIYPGRQASVLYNQFKDSEKTKKYHIGYIAGVFDLYHLGHLNMFRKAKEQCDYLIVGVVTDAGVRDFKKTEPFVPFSERIEMVRSCRYVDEVVEIPYIYRTTIEAFEKYHFDVQFSGSDYINDQGWLNMKNYLEQHGSTMVFFDYTKQTSSTKLKSLIEKKLI